MRPPVEGERKAWPTDASHVRTPQPRQLRGPPPQPPERSPMPYSQPYSVAVRATVRPSRLEEPRSSRLEEPRSSRLEESPLVPA